MIERATGDLLTADVEALVNAVNCVGVMGKGLALQVKRAYPECFRAYAAACKAGEVRPGVMHVFEVGSAGNPKFIINFPTKRHFRYSSRLEDIEAGLSALVEVTIAREIRSIAIPALGCGLGGLKWEEVEPLIVSVFDKLPDVRVLLFPPQ